MKTIKMSIFEGAFTLSDKIQVSSLETGAKLYGGCTKIDEKCYSNVEKNDYMTIYDNKKNTMSILVPSTKDICINMSDEEFSSYVMKYHGKIFNKYGFKCNIMSNIVNGSWYSDEKDMVVVERLMMLSILLDDVTELDIKFFMMLANDIKTDLTQEGVSIFVNDSLAIV